MNSPTTSSRAFLALWNDIDPARIDEYERWHTLEHVPERVWTPGFLSGTRYVATRDGQPRYFTLYDLTDLSALDTPAYQDLVAHPTPWSASMRPAFSHFLRKPCQRAATSGVTRGAALLVLRVVFPHTIDDDLIADRTHRIMVEAAMQVVTSVSAGGAQAAGPQALQNLDDAPAGKERIFLIEATAPKSLTAIEAIARGVLQDQAGNAPTDTVPTWLSASHYRFVSQVMHADVAAPSRPAPRGGLMPLPPQRAVPPNR